MMPFVRLESADHARVEPIVTNPRHQLIIARIRAIPEGFVQTYGDIDPRAPRLVGRILAGCGADEVPWHRVVRADGSLAKGRRQRRLLEREGVPMRGERVDLRQARLPRDLLH
jgi:methylated-DNA-protein-cysteine methyltransferase-like protein